MSDAATGYEPPPRALSEAVNSGDPLPSVL